VMGGLASEATSAASVSVWAAIGVSDREEAARGLVREKKRAERDCGLTTGRCLNAGLTVRTRLLVERMAGVVIARQVA